MCQQCQRGALGSLLPHLIPCCPPCMHCPVQSWRGPAAHSLCGAAGAASLSPKLCSHAAGLGPDGRIWDVLSLPGSPLQPGSHPLSVPFSPSVDQSMFENASAAPTPRPRQVPATAGTLPQPSRPAGSQHLRNLGKAVGAKVNDLLRRKEPASLPSVGVMEVNASAGAMLGTGQLASEDG